MARKHILMLMLLTVVAAGPARAEYEVNLGLGFTNPIGDLSDEVTTSLIYGLGLGIDMAPKFTLGAEIWNHDFSPGPLYEDINPDLSILSYAVTGKIKFAATPETWYIKFLIGGYNSKASLPIESLGVTVSASETNPGFGGGLGFQFGKGTTGGFFEIIVNQVNNSSETATFVDFRVGLRFRFI